MLHYEFMQRAFWAGGFIALAAPALGVYLMLRRQVLMADTLSHVSLAGVALGTLIGVNPVLTAFIVAILCSIGVERLRRTFRSYSEISVAIIMTSGLALAVVLTSLNQGLSKSFSAYLFGSIVAVDHTELLLIAAVAMIAVAYFIVLRRPLYTLTFDEETAQISGESTHVLSMSFSILTGMVVTIAMPVVGVLLVSALMVLPAALALRLASGFTTVLLLAVGIGLTGMFSGLTASYYINTPPGGTIALILLVFLLSGMAIQKLSVRRKRKSRQQQSRVNLLNDTQRRVKI